MRKPRNTAENCGKRWKTIRTRKQLDKKHQELDALNLLMQHSSCVRHAICPVPLRIGRFPTKPQISVPCANFPLEGMMFCERHQVVFPSRRWPPPPAVPAMWYPIKHSCRPPPVISSDNTPCPSPLATPLFRDPLLNSALSNVSRQYVCRSTQPILPTF